MLAMTRAIPDDHRALLQAHVNSTLDRFISIVKSGRPSLSEGEGLRAGELDLATGEIFTPDQAKTYGLIDEIGLWVFQEVCKRVVDWSRKDLPFGRISFNLSQRQLMEPNLAVMFLTLLEGTGAMEFAERIECEITESLIIKQLDIALESINRLKETGMTLAIDDFGTGHSSLINLKRFPLDRLKIDREFVRDIGRDRHDEGIINATLALAQGFQLEVIAEGVESELQRAFLKEIGCHEIQGFLMSKPLPMDEAEALLRQTGKAE
jgi:EAL domain-containing protein (putative c-di-GMP-specific phosphodiesterase class I)